ncbi:MAG: glycosyltransferase family 39 protein [Acidobacteriota bacterium]|nr:glycosyltransferase family 39 protein [Acidobacteriota bacterium]
MPKRTGTRLWLILALAALLRFSGLGVKQLWLDEILQLLHSSPDTVRGILEGVARDRGGAPLDYLVQHLFVANLPGPIEWTARVHAAFFGVLAVYLIYGLCQILFDNPRWSLLSALLLCFYPFHHHYSQEGRPYSLFLLLTLILYLVLFQILKKNQRRLWILFAITALLAFYTHAYTAIALFGQLLILGYYQWLRREKVSAALHRVILFLCCSLLAAAAYVPWLRFSYSNAKGDSPPGNVLRLFFEMVKGLGDGSYPLAIALILCAAAGVYHLRRSQRLFESGALLLWILTPFPLVLIVLNLRNYFFATRQLIFIVPALIMLVAIGADFIGQRYRRRYFSPVMILILISVVILTLHYRDTRDDLRSVGHYLRTNVQPSDAVLAPGLTYALSYYFPGIGAYSADNRSLRELSAERTVSRVFYVDSRFNYTRAGLEDLFAFNARPEEIRFRGVTLYLFRLK